MANLDGEKKDKLIYELFCLYLTNDDIHSLHFPVLELPGQRIFLVYIMFRYENCYTFVHTFLS